MDPYGPPGDDGDPESKAQQVLPPRDGPPGGRGPRRNVPPARAGRRRHPREDAASGYHLCLGLLMHRLDGGSGSTAALDPEPMKRRYAEALGYPPRPGAQPRRADGLGLAHSVASEVTTAARRSATRPVPSSHPSCPRRPSPAWAPRDRSRARRAARRPGSAAAGEPGAIRRGAGVAAGVGVRWTKAGNGSSRWTPWSVLLWHVSGVIGHSARPGHTSPVLRARRPGPDRHQRGDVDGHGRGSCRAGRMTGRRIVKLDHMIGDETNGLWRRANDRTLSATGGGRW